MPTECPSCGKLTSEKNLQCTYCSKPLMSPSKCQADDFEERTPASVISAGFLSVILGRILLYGVFFPLIKSHHIAYHVFKGAIMADFVTWLIIGVMEISLTPGRFAAGFVVNVIIIIYLSQDLFGLPNDVSHQMMMLIGFVLVGLAKTYLLGARLVDTIIDRKMPD